MIFGEDEKDIVNSLFSGKVFQGIAPHGNGVIIYFKDGSSICAAGYLKMEDPTISARVRILAMSKDKKGNCNPISGDL